MTQHPLINVVLGWFGYRRVPRCIGIWSHVGGLHRTSTQYGWQIVRKSRTLPDGATALDYFLADRS